MGEMYLATLTTIMGARGCPSQVGMLKMGHSEDSTLSHGQHQDCLQ